MARWVTLLVLLFALPASASVFETKYFSFVIPESFSVVEEGKDKYNTGGGFYTSVGEKQILMLSYVDQENSDPGRKTLAQLIDKMNAEADADEPGNFLKNIEVEPRDCAGDCKAYYREAIVGHKDGGPAWGCQYLFKNENTMVFLAYIDTVNSAESSRKIMQGFIEQIERSGM